MKEFLTIDEVAEITGKSKTTIYRNIKRGTLKTKRVERRGKAAHEIHITDLEDFLGYKTDVEDVSITGESFINGRAAKNVLFDRGEVVTKDTLRDTMEEILIKRDTNLMKPLEDLAIYKLGKMENEIEHLRGEKETLLSENAALRGQLKALPGPVEDVNKELSEKTEAIKKLEEEKETFEIRHKHLEEDLKEKVEAIFKFQQEKEKLEIEKEKILRDMKEITYEKAEYEKADAKFQKLQAKINTLAETKTALIREKNEKEEKLEEVKKLLNDEKSKAELEKHELQIRLNDLIEEKTTILKEKENIEKEKEEVLKKSDQEKKENDDLKEKLQAEEKEKERLVEIWKKELEEERNKPWWKKLFGN